MCEDLNMYRKKDLGHYKNIVIYEKISKEKY